jgi:hypothetical protein
VPIRRAPLAFQPSVTHAQADRRARVRVVDESKRQRQASMLVAIWSVIFTPRRFILASHQTCDIRQVEAGSRIIDSKDDLEREFPPAVVAI